MARLPDACPAGDCSHTHPIIIFSFSTKPISALLSEADNPNGLKRVLGAGDLVMLAIGAVIGAGIFGAIGTAAAGQTDPAGRSSGSERDRRSSSPSLLLGRAGNARAALLCRSRRNQMIPQAGSATRIPTPRWENSLRGSSGWDLILEYAVGNVAVAISWGDYFTTLLHGAGVTLPVWLTTGYRTALLSSDPAVHRPAQDRPHVSGHPDTDPYPGVWHRHADHLAASASAPAERPANNVMVVVKLVAIGALSSPLASLT